MLHLVACFPFVRRLADSLSRVLRIPAIYFKWFARHHKGGSQTTSEREGFTTRLVASNATRRSAPGSAESCACSDSSTPRLARRVFRRSSPLAPARSNPSSLFKASLVSPTPVGTTSDIRKGRDSNPRYGFNPVQRFSKPPL